MRKKIYAIFVMLALLAMAPTHASCSQCNKGKDKNPLLNCLCPLANLSKQRKALHGTVYVNNAFTTSAASCHPRGSINCPYTNIADAVASKAAIVLVEDTGVHYVLDSGIQLYPGQTLKGATSEAKPQIDVGFNDYDYTDGGIIMANKCVVSGFEIYSTGGLGLGIFVNDASRCTIENNDFHDLAVGIAVELNRAGISSPGLNITGNTFEEIIYGVGLEGIAEAAVSITGNGFTNVEYGVTSFGDTESANSAAKQRGAGKNYAAFVNYLESFGFSNRGKTQAKSGKKASRSTRRASAAGYQITIENNTFPFPVTYDYGYDYGTGAIYVVDAAQAVISGNTASGYDYGIVILGGSSASIVSNTVTDIDEGNFIMGCQQVTLQSNIFTCNGLGYNQESMGVSLPQGATACVQNNSFTGSSFYGFYAESSETGTNYPCLQLTGNTMSGGDTDLVLNTSGSSTLQINSNYNTAGVNTYTTSSVNAINAVSSCPNCTVAK